MIGFRLWISVTFMCIGSAILSWYQTAISSNLSEVSSSVDEEWLPLENKVHSKMITWDDSLPHPFLPKEPLDSSIKSISLLGERNSGTRWIYAHLGLCFNKTLPVHRTLSRYKHWFQYNTSKIPTNTLVIAMFRDPIEWTWAMKAVPHHATRHIDLAWKEFVTKEWTMERLWKDEAWKDEQLARNNTGRICQDNFHYHEVVSCLIRPYPEGYWGSHRKHRFSQHQPLYEMKVGDKKGTPYANILEMRADKIRNFLETASFVNVEGFWYYRYEDLLKQGTEQLVQKIELATGVKRDSERCKVYEPQNRRKRPMDPDFFDYMREHVNWEAEALIGYRRPAKSFTDSASM